MTASAAEVAERLRAVADDRAASSELLASLFADVVELSHTTGSPFDGPIPGAALAEAARSEVGAVERALSAPAFEPLTVTVDGDQVRMRSSVAGTLADGTAVEVRTDTLLTVADGRIVALRSDMDEATMALWGRVLAEGTPAAT